MIPEPLPHVQLLPVQLMAPYIASALAIAIVLVTLLAICLHRSDAIWRFRNPPKPWPAKPEYECREPRPSWFQPAGFVELKKTPEGWKAVGFEPDNYRDDSAASDTEAKA